MGYKNKVANTLMVIGILEMAAGLILGLVFGYERGGYLYSSELHWPIFLLWAGIGAVSGIFVIGFAQVIELLHNINLKLGNDPAENESRVKEQYTRQEAMKLYKAKEKEM